MLVAACADGVPTEVVPSERPSLTAESRLLADTAVVTVTAANEGEVSIRYGRPSLCPMWVHVSTTAARDAVVWNEENWWNANHAGGCKSPTIERVLAPGASERLVGTIAVSDILGDTLPAGVYHVTAALVIGDPGLSRIDVPAGSLDLSPP